MQKLTLRIGDESIMLQYLDCLFLIWIQLSIFLYSTIAASILNAVRNYILCYKIVIMIAILYTFNIFDSKILIVSFGEVAK